MLPFSDVRNQLKGAHIPKLLSSHWSWVRGELTSVVLMDFILLHSCFWITISISINVNGYTWLFQIVTFFFFKVGWSLTVFAWNYGTEWWFNLLVGDTFPLLGCSDLELETIFLRPLQCCIVQAWDTILGKFLMTPVYFLASFPGFPTPAAYGGTFLSLWLSVLLLSPASVLSTPFP